MPPIEQAQFIDSLVPEWPTGTDPRSAGDDHMRLIKQVLQNTFPAVTAAVTGSAVQLNDLTAGVQLQPADTENSQIVRFKVTDPATADAPVLAAMEAATPTSAQYIANPALTLTYQAIMEIIYPVGNPYISFKDSRNPAEILGFGTWEPRGGYLAGAGDVTDTDTVLHSMAAGARSGWWHPHHSHIWSDVVAVTIDEGGSHQHDYATTYQNGDNENDGAGAPTMFPTTGWTGWGGQHAHSGRVQIGTATEFYHLPGHTVYIWERTA